MEHFSATQKLQMIEKEAKKVSLKTSLQIRCYITIPNLLNFKSNSQVIPYPQKKKFWFYLHWLRSYSPNKVKKAGYITTYSITSFDVKNVIIFGFLVQRHIVWTILQQNFSAAIIPQVSELTHTVIPVKMPCKFFGWQSITTLPLSISLSLWLVWSWLWWEQRIIVFRFEDPLQWLA